MKARNKVIVIFLCILPVIILVTLAFYAEQFKVWNSSVPVYSNVLNKLIAEFKALFNISDTFGNDLLKSSISLFIVINPIGSITLFISMTENMNVFERKVVSKNIIITAAALLITFGLVGTQLLSLFGVEIFSFMIAGGILLFIISMELLTYGMWRFVSTVSTDIGVVPLAFPLLTGPGAITSVIISLQTYGYLCTFVAIALALVATYIILRSKDRIYHILGRRGLIVITRVLAIFLAAIAIQYVIQGIRRVLLS
jgi:multiple antibiotic resistance protein